MVKNYILSESEEKKIAGELRNFLLSLFPIEVPFTIQLKSRQTKHCVGSCIYNKNNKSFVCRINIYYYWSNVYSLKEIAIHEYAHLIHKGYLRAFEDRTHGPEFWTIHGILMHKAIQSGLMDVAPYTELVRC